MVIFAILKPFFNFLLVLFLVILVILCFLNSVCCCSLSLFIGWHLVFWRFLFLFLRSLASWLLPVLREVSLAILGEFFIETSQRFLNPCQLILRNIILFLLSILVSPSLVLYGIHSF